MKKAIFILIMAATTAFAQEVKQVPQISVSGEGKIKVIPDEALITISIEKTAKEAIDAKKQNDEVADQVLKLIKKKGISTTDFITQNVSLYKNYDYNSKKHNYIASQTIVIQLKDLTKYDDLMADLVETGINGIQGVEFKSSKIKSLEQQARKNAMLDAKQKAEDFVSVLNGQKVGKAILISDNSFTNYPQPVYAASMMKAAYAEDYAAPKETLAIGEIEIVCNVSVSFILE